jgi:outer membrane receptor for ferrienterochelin and colicin
MRLKPGSLWGAAIALAMAAAPALGQGHPTGTISGRVLDNQGLALAGVNVTVSSPSLQGVRSVVTSINGDYIVPFLPAGEYSVAYELPGFKTRKQEVRVALAESIPLNVSLEMAQVAETITVMGEPPGDFGQTAQVVTSIKAELTEKLPTQRTVLAAVNLAPGVHATGPSGNVTISGGMSFENIFLINGVVAQDNIRNTPFNLFIEDAIQETTVSQAAISAEYGRFGGGVVNAITKSGGNDFSGSYRATFDNNDWVAKTPYPNDTRTDDVVLTHEATLGGPVLKDKLWFFGAARLTNPTNTVTTASFTNIPFQTTDDEKRYEGKLTFSPSTNHTFKGAYTNIQRDQEGNTFPNAQGILDLESLVTRSLPQRLFSANYTGVITSKFFVEAQYSRRQFTFENSGAQFTDIIKGTLLVDRQRNDSRYHSPTFCGVCDPEKRDNQDFLVKANYFLSTGRLGSHNVVGGVDVFDDKRFANNHQSGSDYRILGTTSIIRGSEIFPVFNNDNTTIIQWNPILRETEGNNFRTYSAFVNDTWRFNSHLSFNLGLRYDKNAGKNSVGDTVIKDSAFSPRLAATFDPKGDGRWTINAGYAKYVAAVANSIADSRSPGGQPATFQFDYRGPAVNVGTPANPVSQDEAIRIAFDWFNANGGTSRATRGAPTIPGVTGIIADSLASPHVKEWTVGVTRRLGQKGAARVDGIFRTFGDFYSGRTDLTTGRAQDSLGRTFDRAITENTNDLERSYKALSAQLSYRAHPRLTLGGNYTLSQAKGNVVGENVGSGPIQAGIRSYPEYFDVTWNAPLGDLSVDQRHRARAWATWDLPLPARLGSLNLGLLEQMSSGTPYGASGAVDTRPFVTNPGYLTPPASVNYFFTARDAFHTERVTRTDLALNYSHGVGMGKKAQVFFRGTVLNLFNETAVEDINNLNTTVLTRNNNTALPAFNPFTAQPVEGTHWRKGDTFGQPTSRFAFQTPRTLSFSIGMRF